jgi:hypothetical protein
VEPGTFAVSLSPERRALTGNDCFSLRPAGFAGYITLARNEERGRKLAVFKSLMATRAYTISPRHVEALNSIDLEFLPHRPKERAVLDVWEQYLDHLGATGMDPNAWALRRVDLLVDLLYAMGNSLGYSFNKTQIKNGTYSPVAHGKLEEEQGKVRELAIEVLEGRRPLDMRVVNLPDQNSPQRAEG